MNTDFEQQLEKLLARRFDRAKKEAFVSPAFATCEYGPCGKYLLEAMQPIDDTYSKKVFEVTGRVINKIKSDLWDRNIRLDLRYQGALQSNTHVHLAGEVEIMVILHPREKIKAYKSVQKLGRLIMGMVSESELFSAVDYSNQIHILTTHKIPEVNLTIMPTIWVNTEAFLKSKREIDRGIAEYDFKNKTRKSYLPFRNIARINQKDTLVNGNLKRLIRMVKCIQLDAEEPIDLNDYELACSLYNIHEKKLNIEPEYILSLLPKVSSYLDKLVRFNMFKKVISPSRKELVFGHKKEKGEELLKLKNELDRVIEALKAEMGSNGKSLDSPMAY